MVAALTALTMALALFGVLAVPKQAFAAGAQMTITVNLPATVSNLGGDTEVSFSTYDLDGTADAGTWTSGTSASTVAGVSTIAQSSSNVSSFTAKWTPTNAGPYVIGAQITKNDGADSTTVVSGRSIEYGIQSVIAADGAQTATITFTDYKSPQASDNPSASTTVTATIPEGLTLSGGDALIDFGSVQVGADYTKTGNFMRVISSVTNGYKLQAQTSTASGEMGLDGVTNSTATEFIPWGDATQTASASTKANSAWHVAFTASPQDPNDTALVQSPFTALDAAGAGPSASPVQVANSASAGGLKVTGDDRYTPQYGLALQSAQAAGSYATTITYTLLAA
jgi:hypothetical protein